MNSDMEGFRQLVREKEPPIFNIPLAQPVILVLVVIATWVWAFTQVEQVTWKDLLGFPFTWGTASLFEYWFHRGPLHQRKFPLEHIYDIHTKMHHRFYQWPDITMPSLYDIRTILFPWWAIFVHVLITGALSYFVLTPWIGHNGAWVVFASASAYFGFYEIIHMICHLPESHWVHKMAVFRWLRNHHGLHHVPSRMNDTNFNVVLPLGDLIFRTLRTKV